MESLYILFPAYNEEDNIAKIIEAWYPLIEDKGEESRLVINCSGSTDDTFKIIEKSRELFPNIDIITNSENTYGAKVLDLYDFAVQNNADYIFQTDSDGQTNPHEFATFWNLREQYDAIIGKRKKRGDGAVRTFVMKVECLMIKMFFGVKVPDANVPFRLMNNEILSKYIQKIPRDYSMPNILLTAYMAYYHENIRFEEISFANRSAGVQSMNIKKIFRIGLETIDDFYKIKQEIR